MQGRLRLIGYQTLVCTLVLTLAIAGAGAFRLAAQAATATIQGTVTDASSAAVPDAMVQLRNINTGVTQTTTSNGQGRFVVPDLAVGEYEVQVSKTGFSTVVRRGITLTVGAQSVVDFSLPVGQQSQTVTVEGQASTVETTNATVGQLTDQKQMRDLPLNGRNFEQLILLTPGVQTIQSNGFVSSGFQGRAPEYSVAGSRPTGQAILLDDENLQNFWNKGMGSVSGSSLGVEAIGEFQTLTNTYSAQFGGNGAVINAVSKSGTNAFHGSAYEFLRNSALDARGFFDPKDVPAFRKNQFGGSIGGPIKKDKMFFFANYEGVRQLLGESRIAFVPGCNLPQFAATCVPSASAKNPQAIRDTLAAFPNANLVVNNQPEALSVSNQTAHENYVLSRFDYNISDKDALFIRYISDKSDLLDPFGGGGFGGGPVPYWPEQDFSHMQFVTTEWRRIVSATIVNVARASFSRPGTNEFTTQPVGNGIQGGKDPLQFFPGTGRQTGTVQIQGLSGIGGALQLPFNTTQNRYTEADDVTWTHGAHSFKFGASVSRLQSNTFMPFFQGGQWAFHSLAEFVTGVPDVAIFSPLGSYANRDFRNIEFMPYAQDDWKVSPKLTLNLGLRWEFSTNPVDQHNQLYWVPNIATAVPPYWQNIPHVMETNPAWKNFNPRVGFAYDPFADHKTSIRGGFGMFHELISVQNFSPAFWASYPYPLTLGLPLPFLPPLNYPTIPQGGLQIPSAFPGWDYHVQNTPYVIQYNLNVQRELTPGTVVTVGYIGSHGVHLFTGQEQNPPVACSLSQGPGCALPPPLSMPPAPGSAGTFANGFAGGYVGFGTPGNVIGNPRLNPGLGSFPNLVASSTSRYNSMLGSLNRRFSRNVQAQASYTWSRCIDDGGYLGSFNSNSTGNWTNPYNRSVFDKAPCSYDVTHVFKLNGLVALPFHGNRLVEGWQISGIVSASSGLVYNITDGYDEAYGGSQPNNLAPRPNYVAGCKVNVGTVNEWYNPACFTLEAPGTFGNLGRNTGRGPDFADVDFALLKDTKIRESLGLQFRAEFFNILNHTNLGLPVPFGVGGGSPLFNGNGFLTNPGDLASYNARNPSAPQITSIVGAPRQIQFALKLVF
jgi:hypothetical protein